MSKTEYNQIPEPPISQFIFGDTRLSLFWLVIRLYTGWEWLVAGWEKVNNSSWVGNSSGLALKGFLLGALKKTHGTNPDVSVWYAFFIKTFVIPNTSFFAHCVAYGELLVGIGLILGLFTGIAAFFGAFMNMNYLFAGTVSVNPLLFLMELLLILAWRTAGFIGLDKYILPLLGTPWYPGKLFKKNR